MDTLESQRKQVLEHLTKHGSITPVEADNLFASKRLAVIINRLRNGGHNISTEMVEDINRFGHKVRFARYHYHGTFTNPINQ